MHDWWRLTAFGDSTVLLPMALLIAVWLLVRPSTRRIGWVWLVLVFADVGLVIVSKVAYMAWGLRPPGLDFIGLSGHCAMAFLFWPIVGVLIGGPSGWSRWLGAAAGMVFAAAIVVSRLALQTHSPSEVVLGGLWGLILVAAFLWLARKPVHALPAHAWIVLLVLVPPLFLTSRLSFPSNRVLAQVAMQLNGHGWVFTRRNIKPMQGAGVADGVSVGASPDTVRRQGSI